MKLINWRMTSLSSRLVLCIVCLVIAFRICKWFLQLNRLKLRGCNPKRTLLIYQNACVEIYWNIDGYPPFLFRLSCTFLASVEDKCTFDVTFNCFNTTESLRDVAINFIHFGILFNASLISNGCLLTFQ